MQKTILIMAGGTGGHVFPGLAVADFLRAQGHRVEWLGTQHGLDTKLVPAANITLHRVSIRGLRGKGKLGLLLAPFKIFSAILQSLKILRQVKPDVVLGMGGYVAGPGGVACWLMRIPLIVHEQNAIPGKTNSLLTHFATQVLEAFPNSFSANKKAQWVGNPIRESLCHLPAPAERLNQPEAGLKVLVFGGSQGAQAINHCILALLEQDFAKQHFQLWHQVGAGNDVLMQTRYRELDFEAKVEAFIDDMPAAYAWADVVICRAGALSVSEIAAVGVASILIPFPFAVDDHQSANAKSLQANDAAYVIQERVLKASDLLAILRDFSDNRAHLIHMAQQARQLAKPEATQTVAQICLEAAK
jgi:UDP-N-acetylglucosamine--N-acetylmuramyl-(pentapeptide) pyrophosphoryl-undecaprenol N-acetylglucosamine transferase